MAKPKKQKSEIKIDEAAREFANAVTKILNADKSDINIKSAQEISAAETDQEYRNFLKEIANKGTTTEEGQ